MKVKNKWEVALVLVVVAAGIVITTVAAIKAKEKRQMALHETNTDSKRNEKNPSVSHINDLAPSRSTHHVNINSASSNPFQTSFVSDGRKTKSDDFTPDYDVEYDMVKSTSDEYSAMASESVNQSPKSVVKLFHDGLPGFPPPIGAPAESGAKAELTADGAGFVIESQQQTSDSQAQPFLVKLFNKENNEPIPKPSANVDQKISNNNNNNKNIDNNNNSNNNKIKLRKVTPPSIQVEPQPKRVAVFSNPPLEGNLDGKNGKMVKGSISNNEEIKNVMGRVSILNNDEIKTAAVQLRAPGNDNKLTPQQISNLRNALPSIESAIRFLGLTDEIAHPIEYSPGALPSISNIPLPVRRFLSLQNNNNRKKRSLDSDKKDKYLLVHHIIRDDHNDSVPESIKDHKVIGSEPIGSDSRFFSFNENGPLQRVNNEEDNSPNDDISSIFNFDALSDRFSSGGSSARTFHHQPVHQPSYDSHYPGETRKHYKYGILGSGNFEIIRGGIYAADESASNHIPNYVPDDNHDEDSKSSSASQSYNNESPNDEENNDGPYNMDFFANNPVLGFQGYDNFGAASITEHQPPEHQPPKHQPAEHRPKHTNEHRRHFFQHAAASNLIPISTPFDLDTDS